MSLPFNHTERYGKVLITVSQNKICQKSLGLCNWKTLKIHETNQGHAAKA